MAKITEKDDYLNAALISRVKPTARPGVKGEPELNKEAVNNPFPMGPNTEFQQPGRAMKQMINKPKDSYQSSQNGKMILDTLLSFAGTGAKVYELEMNKKIKADKIVQTSRAAQNLAPTDDATVAGYTAHAAVKIGNYTNKVAAEMHEVSKQGVPDDVWEEKLGKAYKGLDEYMSANYEAYNKMPELKELAAVALSEKALEMSATREIHKVDIEIKKRVNTFSDSVTLAINQPGKDVAGTVAGITKVGTVLKLTPAQIDQGVLDSIKNTGTLEAIEIAKSYTGVGRKTSLYERTPELQNLEKQLTKKGKEEVSFDAAHIRNAAEKEYIEGGDEKKFLVYAKTDKSITQGRINELTGKRDKFVFEKNRVSKISLDITDPTKIVDPTTTPNELQAGLQDYLTYNIRLNEQRLGVDSMEEGEAKKEAINKARATAIRQTTNAALSEGTVIKQFISDFDKAATTDFAVLQTQYNAGNLDGRKTALSFEKTPQSFQDAVNTFQAMSPAAQHQHLLAMDQDKADTWREALDLIDSGVDEVEAFRRGQTNSRIPKSQKTKEIIKAGDQVIEEIGKGLLTKDIPENQEVYVNELIRGELSRSQNPGSEANIKRVAANFKKDHTISDGIYYMGSKKKLEELTHLNSDKLTEAFNLVKSSPGIADRLKLASETYMFNVQDVFVVTNPKTRSYHFRSPDGSYVSDEYDLGEVRDIWHEETVAAAEEADKIQEDRNRKTQEEKKRFDRYNSLTEEAKPINTLDKDSWVDRFMSKGNKGRKKQEEDDKYLNNHKQRAGISLK